MRSLLGTEAGDSDLWEVTRQCSEGQQGAAVR